MSGGEMGLTLFDETSSMRLRVRLTGEGSTRVALVLDRPNEDSSLEFRFHNLQDVACLVAVLENASQQIGTFE